MASVRLLFKTVSRPQRRFASTAVHVITESPPPIRWVWPKITVAVASGLVVGSVGASTVAKVLDEDLGWFHYEPEDDDDDDDDDDDNKNENDDNSDNNSILNLTKLSQAERVEGYRRIYEQQLNQTRTAKQLVQTGWEKKILEQTEQALQHNLDVLNTQKSVPS